MRVAPAGFALFLLLSLLGGCFGANPEPGPSPTSAVFVDPLTSDTTHHNHSLPSDHHASWHVNLVAHLPLITDEGKSAQSHSIDRCSHWVVLGREDPGSYGVDLVDVADPAQPVWVGQYRDNNAVPGDRDVAWSADCKYVFMANQGTGATTDSSGVRVINTVDKAHPAFESFYVIPGSVGTGIPGASVSGGVHSVFAFQAGDTQYVYALNYGVHILKLQPGLDGKQTLVLAGRYVTADAQRLVDANEKGLDPVATRRTIYGHDMTVYPEGGRVIMYVAFAYDGLRIVDITNPAVPVDLGHWVPETPGAPHYVHGVKSYLRADGRRITIVEAETFEDRNTDTPSPLWFVDTTDPAHPQLLSTWVNPGRHGADHLLFSTHFFEVENERVWLTHYHGGVWVLDASDPAHPNAVGYYLPSEDTGYRPPLGCCIGFKLAGIPMTFDIKVKDGVAYAADFATGLYVLRLDS